MTKLMSALFFAVALAACSRSEPEAPPETNAARSTPTIVSRTPTASPVPAPPASPAANASMVVPPPMTVGADEQMLDDASATGMTARVQREQEEEAGEPAHTNSAEP